METLGAIHAWWHGLWPIAMMPDWLFITTEVLAAVAAVSLLSAVGYGLGAREVDEGLLIPWVMMSLSVLFPPTAVLMLGVFLLFAAGGLCVAARKGVQQLRDLPHALARHRQRRQAEEQAYTEQLERDYQEVVRMIRE